MRTGPHRDLHGAGARHRVAVQVVVPALPGDATFAYTVGNHGRGLPELVVFGQHPAVAGEVLRGVTDRLLAEPAPGAGDEVAGVLAGMPVRLRAVVPHWAREYALAAFDHYRVDEPAAIPCLQVVVPDLAGRFQGEPGYDRSLDQAQPDLSRDEDPWRAPFRLAQDTCGVYEADVAVLLPIILAGTVTPRLEAVPALVAGRDRARLVRPPVLADWVGSDAVVETGEPVGDTEAPLPTRRYRRVLRESPHCTRVWRHHAGDQAAVIDLVDTVAGIVDLGVRTAVTSGSVHVAVPASLAGRVDADMRRLVRDGVASEVGPYHRGICVPPCAHAH